MSVGFNKKLPPSCEYCVYGKESVVEGENLCIKRGVTGSGDYCKSYRYDPLRRVPKKVKLSDNYSPEDFTL